METLYVGGGNGHYELKVTLYIKLEVGQTIKGDIEKILFGMLPDLGEKRNLL